MPGPAAFGKILIANRGEIAVRVIRTCREMGIRAAAVYSKADRTAKHVRMADEAHCIGDAPARDSYLNASRILEAAERSGAQAVHPGYGFLSENADFADLCTRAGFRFIGPPAAAIRSMGTKTEARSIMKAAGVPVVPGSEGAVRDARHAAEFASGVGYPVMLKAAAGGGGKGMRLVRRAEDLPSAWDRASDEALSAFGDPVLYVEKAIVRPRHVEVQVLADEQGHVIHLGERECSLQRRHQKVLEETPSPLVEAHPEVRDALCTAAVRAARAAGYTNAGTVEFLMDSDCRFYFLEMNTRLQVEHPVTELVTGIDLVREQIRIAAGRPLGRRTRGHRSTGHAIQCRIYAEDPGAGFLPSPGRIRRLALPGGPGVRVDCGAEEGWTVPVEYDPLIAKLCVWAPTRPLAIDRLRGALSEFTVDGIATTLPFFRRLMDEPSFLAGTLDTGMLERELLPAAGQPPDLSRRARLAAVVAAVHAHRGRTRRSGHPGTRQRTSRWKGAGRRAMLGWEGGSP